MSDPLSGASTVAAWLPHSPPHVRRRTCLVLITALAALVSPAAAEAAYSAGQSSRSTSQHPVRGFFGDPRVGERRPAASVEDVSLRHRHLRPRRHGCLRDCLRQVSGSRSAPRRSPSGQAKAAFSRTGTSSCRSQRAVRRRHEDAHWSNRARLGARAPRGVVDGRYVNPLRRGALTPYVDWTRPTIHTFSFERDGRSIGRTKLAGRFDLVTETWDETPVRVPGKWARRLTPAVVRWRILGTRVGRSWQTALDFSAIIPAPELFDSVYARWTRQNHAWRPGRYRVQIARDWDSASPLETARDVLQARRSTRAATVRGERFGLGLELKQRRRIGRTSQVRHDSQLGFPAHAPPRPRLSRARLRAHCCRSPPHGRPTRLLAGRGSAANPGCAPGKPSASGFSWRTNAGDRSAGSSSRSVAAS